MTTTNLTLAAAGFEISHDKTGRIQLLPYGEFRATDGRPFDVPAWIIANSNGADIVALANNQRNPLPIDYEHQIIHSKTNGKEAPCAGWMDYLYFTPQGIFADVRWTDKAADYIKNGEYRFISAVFAYDNEGYVRKIFHAALTNFPALDGMDEAIVSASAHFDLSTTEGHSMNKETLALLSALFGLSDATEQDIIAALTALAKDKSNSPVALSQVYTQLAEKEQKMAALSAQATQVNSAQYVPIDQVVALQQEITQLRSAVEGDKREGLIQAALTNGKLSPALVDWARKLSVADLTGFLDKATPVAALGGNPQAKDSPNQTVVALSAAEQAAVKMLGMTNEDYIAQNKEQK